MKGKRRPKKDDPLKRSYDIFQIVKLLELQNRWEKYAM